MNDINIDILKPLSQGITTLWTQDHFIERWKIKIV